jgi:hypothetical protein
MSVETSATVMGRSSEAGDKSMIVMLLFLPKFETISIQLK